jgi:hypothetical protein
MTENSMSRLKVVIVTPALADANNGNWRTARRWASMLRDRCDVRLTAAWSDGDESVMIALHARRSAASAAAWRARHPERPLIVVLTGTDLYRDIATDASARHSLDIADRLVVLNTLGPRSLPDALQPRCRVVLQSCPSRVRQAPPARYLRALMIGHLRAEKAPDVLFDAVRELAVRRDIRIDHIGSALDPELGEAARRLMIRYPGLPLAGRFVARRHASSPAARQRAGASEPHGRRCAYGDRGDPQRRAGSRVAHRRQCRPARRGLRRLLCSG